MPHSIAEVYTFTHDLEDLKESLKIMLHCAGFENIENFNESNSQANDFENTLSHMERQGELTGIEKSRLVTLYKNSDPRIMGMWESYNSNKDFEDFTESIHLFSCATSLNINSSDSKKSISRRKSYK